MDPYKVILMQLGISNGAMVQLDVSSFRTGTVQKSET